MEIGKLIVDPSPVALAAGLLGLVGAVVWWLVRKRQRRVWLPTIRVLDLESRVLPRLVLRLPPIVSFLCFVAIAAVVTLFALKPRTPVFTPFEPNQTRIHVLIDMSASVSAHVRLEDYAARVATLYGTLKDSGRVTLSTSHAPTVAEPASADEARAVVTARGFHRSGFRYGSGLKAMLDQLGEVDRLFIVGDRDAHTWAGFNWRYLQDEMDVTFVDVAGGAEPVNVFVNDARFLSASAAATMDWEVEIARRGGGPELSGELVATHRGVELARTPWQIADGKARVMVRLSWPAAAILKGRGAAAREEASKEPLVFAIQARGDVLALDDELRTEPLGLKQDALVIAETGGERMLEDPAKQLTTSLGVLGFRAERRDFVQPPGPGPEEAPLWILLGGYGSGVDRFCPQSLVKARNDARQAKRALPKIWLAPHDVDADWKELCRCYARLMKDEPTESPQYCELVESRSHWVGLLPSLGAKQIGGEIGDASNSLAFAGRDQQSGLETLAFTVPLAPRMQTGISYAAMPLLVKDLLRWQGIALGGGAAWPRVEDLAETWAPRPGEDPETRAAFERQVALSNVPLGESLLAEVDPAALPPRWTSQLEQAARSVPARKDREDPLPWLKLAAAVCLAALVIEGAWVLGLLARRWLGRRPEAALWPLLLVAGLGAGARPAEAKVELNLVGYGEAGLSFATLAREVTHRTSIELAVKPEQAASLQNDALAAPWLWVRDLRDVADGAGVLRPEVMIWLRRGGFLVIEAPAPDEALDKLAQKLGPGDDPVTGKVFLPLPPDHELMRSFYLVDALPTCNGQIWRGLAHDGRLAVLAIPYGFLSSLKDRGSPPPCPDAPDYERSVRIFVNLVMVALATDYKKDQIHLPEILKRLR